MKNIKELEKRNETSGFEDGLFLGARYSNPSCPIFSSFLSLLLLLILHPLMSFPQLQRYQTQGQPQGNDMIEPGKDKGSGERRRRRRADKKRRRGRGEALEVSWKSNPYSPSHSGKTLEEPSVILNARR